jgi:PilZ domain
MEDRIMDRKRSLQSEMPGNVKNDVWLLNATGERVVRDYRNEPSADALTRQRGGIRKTIPCSILVKVGASYVIARKIHDISLVGAYVEMDPAGLALGDEVEVVMDFAYKGRNVEHAINAEVVRIENEGVGMKFNTYGNRTYTDLVNLLYAA